MCQDFAFQKGLCFLSDLQRIAANDKDYFSKILFSAVPPIRDILPVLLL